MTTDPWPLWDMERYRIVKRLEDGIVVLLSKFGQQMFTQVTIRKATKCAHCEATLETSARAFSPITNGYNRMHRICLRCVDVEMVNARSTP